MNFMAIVLSIFGIFGGATATEPAVRVNPPVVVIEMPTPKFTLPYIVVGGQLELDQGNVVLLNQPVPCWPGNDWGCPPFIGGHRSTHGSPFAEVANLQPGDIVKIDAQDNIATDHYYVIETHKIVCCVGSLQDFDFTYDLFLQTSATNNRVHWLEATEIK